MKAFIPCNYFPYLVHTKEKEVGKMTAVKILQYLFSGLGIMILSYFYYQMFKPQKKEIGEKTK
jgi:uncharacterized protein (DUF2164 family)